MCFLSTGSIIASEDNAKLPDKLRIAIRKKSCSVNYLKRSSSSGQKCKVSIDAVERVGY